MRKMLALVITAILLSACGRGVGEKPVEAPYFEVKGIDGRVYRLSDYKGKPLLLVFWATWCPTCKKELSTLAQHYDEIKRAGISILLVCESKDKQSIIKTAREHGFYNLPIAIVSDQMIMDYQWVRFLPTGLLIDKRGYIVKKFVGELPVDQIIKSAQEAP